jgi:SEC-C motif/Glycosyl transferase family 2
MMTDPQAFDDRVSDTTVVITSCGRYDLLARTLESFRKFNTDHRIAHVLVVEDGNGDPSDVCQRYEAEVIRAGRRIGQMAAIDLAYSQVQTPYIFHLEDDWEFHRSGFIERSRQILEVDPSTLLVMLRAWNDTNGHPLIFKSDDRTFGVMAFNFNDLWHGFSFNPGLRRLVDYKLLGSYSRQPITVAMIHRRPSVGLQMEAEASRFYFLRGFRAVILDETGYLRHIGEGRHVSHADDALFRGGPEFFTASSRNALCPCGSGRRFKHCHGHL